MSFDFDETISTGARMSFIEITSSSWEFMDEFFSFDAAKATFNYVFENRVESCNLKSNRLDAQHKCLLIFSEQINIAQQPKQRTWSSPHQKKEEKKKWVLDTT